MKAGSFASVGAVSAYGVLWLAATCVSACGDSVDTNLAGKRCSASGTCLPGYVCNDDFICEADSIGNALRADPSGAASDPAIGTTIDAAPLVTTDAAIGGATDAALDAGPAPFVDAGVGPEAGWDGAAGAFVDASADASDEVPSGCEDTLCDEKCVDITRDPHHCGQCGKACKHHEQRCVESICVALHGDD